MFGPQTIALPNFLVANLAPALSQQRLILCGANTLSVGDDFIILLLFNFFLSPSLQIIWRYHYQREQESGIRISRCHEAGYSQHQDCTL